jgi:hypothetical protein
VVALVDSEKQLDCQSWNSSLMLAKAQGVLMEYKAAIPVEFLRLS